MAEPARRQGHHDELAAKCFEDPQLARAFLGHYLPAVILEQIDLEALEVVKDSYVDEELRRSYSDLCFKVPLCTTASDSRVQGFVYVLIEHKSESDEFTLFQLIRYTVRIWERELARAKQNAGFRLPPIIPLVLHHGRTEFRAPVDFESLVVAVPGLERYVPKFSCLLVDLLAIPPEELPDADDRLYAVLSVMRSIFGADLPGSLRESARRMAAHASRPETQETFRILIQYVLQSASTITTEEIVEAIRPLGKVGDETMSTLIDKWREEGREEGWQKGREAGREEGREEGQISDRQDSIIDFLSARFGSVPEPLCQAVRAITEREQLVRLTTKAATCETIDQFAESLSR